MTTAQHLDLAAVGDGGLAARSVEILLAGQANSGAFLACPTYPTYRYAWLRDGAFCARALDVVGEHEPAARFHRWVELTLHTHRAHAEALIEQLNGGRHPPPEQMLPARYGIDGQREDVAENGDEPWPNYQLDGYGTWLCELAERQRTVGGDFDQDAVDLAARYIAAAWRTNCWDCWEEYGDGQHASTLAAVAAGLSGAAELLHQPYYEQCADQVRESLLTRFTRGGLLRKGGQDERLDASLLWLAVPFQVLDPAGPLMRGTANAIRQQLRGRSGGLYRYLGDTYYGGGEWILLTCWLGWYDAITGNHAGWQAARDWVLAHASSSAELAEQVSGHAQNPAMIDPWVRRWGQVASPLLWSHAMYLILTEAGAAWT